MFGNRSGRITAGELTIGCLAAKVAMAIVEFLLAAKMLSRAEHTERSAVLAKNGTCIHRNRSMEDTRSLCEHDADAMCKIRTACRDNCRSMW